MLFDSIDFAIFLPIVFVLYWLAGTQSRKLQNLLIVIASYIFYGWWSWIFLSLIFYSTVVDYFVGLALSREKNLYRRKFLLFISILFNLGFLGIFKYYNFFIDNFIATFSLFGVTIGNSYSLVLILPVGISFYTFQTLSYTIDIYKQKFEPTKDFIAFSAFVSFFPQLVAGPIERASHLLPQFYVKRTFNYSKAVDGLRQILWGLFKKIVIADNCAELANHIFENSESSSGVALILGSIFFTFQIYTDFSGYSDIAIGTSRLLGFNLKRNFAFPYFSRDIAEFWRRWHISLSTWFRDYLYIPLGGSKGSTAMKVRNTFIIFIVSGFWHGANWTFIVWGTLNAIYFLPILLTNKNRINLETVAKGKYLPTLSELNSIIITFILTTFAWVFFRADNITHAYHYILGMFKLTTPSEYDFINVSIHPFTVLSLIFFFVLIEWIGREQQYAIERFAFGYNRTIRWSFYLVICLTIIIYQGKEQEFIYFQF